MATCMRVHCMRSNPGSRHHAHNFQHTKLTDSKALHEGSVSYHTPHSHKVSLLFLVLGICEQKHPSLIFNTGQHMGFACVRFVSSKYKIPRMKNILFGN